MCRVCYTFVVAHSIQANHMCTCVAALILATAKIATQACIISREVYGLFLSTKFKQLYQFLLPQVLVWL